MTVPNVVAAIAMQVYEPVALRILKPDAPGRAKRTQAGCRTHLRHENLSVALSKFTAESHRLLAWLKLMSGLSMDGWPSKISITSE
jgi:hypothetical protein